MNLKDQQSLILPDYLLYMYCIYVLNKWPEFRSVAQLSMIEMRIWGVKMLRQLSELHRRNLTKQVRRCQKGTVSSRRILQFGPVFCALKKLGTGGGEPAAKGGTAPSCCSSEKAASGLPPWKSVFFFPAGNLFFFRFGGRKWKCPWVSWRWQMRYEGGFQKHKSTASWLLDIGCIPCHTNFSHALQGMISQRTNLEMKCRQVNYIDVFSAKCRL